MLVDEGGAFVFYQPNFLAATEAEELYALLNTEVTWRVEIDDFGKQDRATHYMGDKGCTFTYVGLENKPNGWSPAVMALRRKVETTINECYRLSEKCCIATPVRAIECKGCLLNKYEDGDKHIPWHSDTVTDHGDAKLVATVSLGAPRLIDFRRQPAANHPAREHGEQGVHAAAAGAGADVSSGAGASIAGVGVGVGEEGAAAVSQLMAPGSLTVMAGTTQDGWQHRIPSDPTTAKGRISLTFRSMVPIVQDVHEVQPDGGGASSSSSSGSSSDSDAALAALIQAAKDGDAGFLSTALASAGTRAAAGDGKGETALHHASARGHKDCVQTLLAFNKCGITFDVNAPSNTGASPLVAAAVKGRHIVVKMLLARPDVDPNHVGLRGRGALHGAVRHGHPLTVKVLLQDGRVDPNIVDHEGRSAFDDAARKNRPEVMTLLLECARFERDRHVSAARAAVQAEIASNGEVAFSSKVVAMLGL